MPREPKIVNGRPVSVPDADQVKLDSEDSALRLRDLAQALCEEEEARRTLRDLQCQVARAKHRVKETHNRVVMLASLARRRYGKG